MARVDYKDMIKFTEEAIVKSKLLEGLDPVPLETYDGMDTRSAWEFKTPMASGFYKPYTLRGSTKIEKITYGELHYMRRAIYIPPTPRSISTCVSGSIIEHGWSMSVRFVVYTSPRLAVQQHGRGERRMSIM